MTLPLLTPIKHQWIKSFTKKSDQIKELIERYHSPINVHHMAPFEENYKEFSDVFNQYDLAHKIYFARKANKSIAFVKEAKRLDFGVDTASFKELSQCLEVGIPSENIALTAAVKEERLVRLAIENKVPIVIDNLDECALVQQVAEQLNKKVKVGIRIGGFLYEGKPLYSRFGFPPNEVVRMISENLGSRGKFNHLEFSGFHFHLNGYSPSQRAEAIIQTLTCVDELKSLNIPTQFIDIGGGFLINYLEDENQWNHFHEQLRKAIKGEREEVTFRNDSLGYQLIDGNLYGDAKVYPYYNDKPRAKFLKEILIYQDEYGTPVHSLLKNHNIEVRIEPGRSLLDQTGITCARVAFRKIDIAGNLLIGLEMNRTQMFSSSLDFLLDPIVLHQSSDSASEHVSGYLVGAYCLEQELILKRKIAFKQKPQIGDIVCFVNTAGYMMHFYESEAHLFDLAKNLVAVSNLDEFIVKPDEE
ncbi:type III PLP-dependent enzyme domain-containing protein [Anditalea andensis]|uniref:Orn/DAP/Arg decarboxylase 2 N-terminal domain-containing protein n=1 Tax=Anditalea andensis TaxID=1048983 RepID=A0A074KX65_9BACT|nr:alanine racemase [Anditalea andensis]KEO73549.1 hypothetical protein EL17_11655 [Anditalea andensis]